MDHLDKAIIILNNFNLCPLTDSAVLGTECLHCEHMINLEEEYFCTFDDEENLDGLQVKVIIDKLLDLLISGQTEVSKEEIIRMITDM